MFGTYAKDSSTLEPIFFIVGRFERAFNINIVAVLVVGFMCNRVIKIIFHIITKSLGKLININCLHIFLHKMASMFYD